jgi:hypothetical protein
MNMNVTIDPGCIQTVRDNAARWINEAAEWSVQQYGKVDIESGTTWSVEPYEFNAATLQPQHRPIAIQMSEIDNVGWTPEIQKREWFKSQLFHTGYEVGIKASAIALLRSCKHTLARDIDDQQYREGWDSKDSPMEEKLAFIKGVYPQLIDFWTDRSGWLDEFRKNIKPTHWTFPAINPKLCRYGRWGEGAVFPEGSGRK